MTSSSALLAGALLILSLHQGVMSSPFTTDPARLAELWGEKNPGTVWPQPQKVSKVGGLLTLDAELEILDNAPENPIIVAAKERYRRLIFLDECLPIDVVPWNVSRADAGSNPGQGEPLGFYLEGTVKQLYIHIDDPSEVFPHVDMEESYELSIESGVSTLKSKTVWGALRGLETFSQLVFKQIDVFVIREQEIVDFPRFPFRALLVDTSRHFIPVKVLLQNLDAMAYNKMNVFHWHIVDDPSFPYVSTTFPDLSREGAYNPKTHIYTPEDVHAVIKYAAERGIRVVPEFDTPGHTQSWGRGQPGLLTPCPGGGFGPINPVRKSSYKFIHSLFKEVAQVFPDKHFFAGGDEVDFKCWKSSEEILQFMKKYHFGYDFRRLQSFYFNKTVDIIHRLGKSPLAWEEIFDITSPVSKDTIFNVWLKSSLVKDITGAGYRAVTSHCWYFNYIHYGSDWVKAYKCDPQDFDGTPEQKKLILGGEACMWGEYVDGSNLISRTWPRTSTAAERLWSSAEIRDVSDASRRLEALRCLMQKRGLRAEPVNGPSFCPCDYVF